MKKSIFIKRTTALLSAVLMILLASCGKQTTTEEPATGDDNAPLVTYTDTTQTVKKTENVFINLNADGTTKKVTVSDWLHADKSNVQITDITTLKDFVVTKGQAALVGEGGKLTWHMTESDVYYEGTSDKQLPIDISIKYFLDEAEIAPVDLAGKSGKFRMEISMVNNMKSEVEVNGQKMTMYAPLAVAGGIILPYENFTEITVENCTSVGAGSYEVVAITGTPGLDESLGITQTNIQGLESLKFPSTFTISATVTDFTLGDIYFAAMPISSLNIDLEVPKTVEDAQNLLSQVRDLGLLLEQIDPNQVVANFITDTAAVKEMLDVVKKGLNLYNDNKKMLETFSNLLTPENINTLTNFLNTVEDADLQSMLSNPLIQTFIGSMSELSAGLDEVKPIMDQFSAAMEDPEVAKSMENLPQTLQELSELMTYLNENKELLDIMAKLMESDNLDSLTAALDQMTSNTTVSGNASITDISAEGEKMLDKMEVWLSLNYKIYTAAPDYMETSCMFIYKTDPIK